MSCLDIVRVVISPSSSHPFGLFVIRHDVVVIREVFVANPAFFVLLHNFSIQQFPHFGLRSQFSISSWMMRILDPLNPRV